MRRIIRGRVDSDKGDKTIVVRIVMRPMHPVYKKQYTRHRKFMAHDEKNEAKVGDLVTIRESRPISARKRFVLEKIVERGGAGFEETVGAAVVPL
ncbi:30S ribosomal protein S17 [Candidatus Saccharibacteria bacterium]|nr:30S ribosomal protein S17 [Candidatus Saccharibacteria bacterium]